LKLVPFENWGRFPIRLLQQRRRYLVSFARYSDLLVENREIFIPYLYFAPPQGVTRRNFAKVFDADKTRMIGLPCVRWNRFLLPL